MKRIIIVPSLFVLSVFTIAGAARAQTYSAGAHNGYGGCLPVTSGSPVSLSGCEYYYGCAGTNALTVVNYVSSGPVVINTGYSMTLRSWQNLCGDRAYVGGGGSWDVPVVFSGPGPSVTVQAQADFEWVYNYFPTGAAHGSPGSDKRFDASVGLDQYGTSGAFIVNFNGVFNWIGATVTHIDANSLIASGRMITAPIAVPTGVPVSFRMSCSNSGYSGSPSAGEDNWVVEGTIRPPASGPVFILPEGYTANSPALGIVNNQFPPPPCDGDADGNNMVDFGDLTTTLANWGANYAPASGPGDSNHDGTVDFTDITTTLSNWGDSCS